MGLEIGARELAVLPDATMLTDPSVRYPLYIDPSYSATRSLWTMVNADAASTSYWTDAFYREDVRVGTVYGTGDGPWRTFFHFNIAPLARATVSRSWFSITMTHTADCAEVPVSLWHTSTLNSANAVTWNNSGGFWLGGAALDTQWGKANKSACGQPAKLMEFGLANGSVRNVVQAAANGPQEAVGFGLRNPSEGTQLHWKRFNHTTARLITEYNTAPHAPAVSTVPPTPCGTAAAPTPLGTATPAFSGVGHDPNADNVLNEVELLAGDTVIFSAASATVGSDSAVAWLAVPPGILATGATGTVYSYRARTRDATLYGPYSTRCYFTVDTVRPAPPSVTSTDYPGVVPVKSVGETGLVTFARAATDTDVAGFRYGFSQNATTMWVAADAAGSATVPVTLWPSSPGDTGDVSRVLFVRAVNRAGNASPLNPGWDLAARARSVTAAPVRGDVNGDRRADVSAIVDQGFDRTTVWNLLASPGGFHNGYIGWDTEVTGGMPADRVRSATGDFNGDGRTDVALYREDPDQLVRLFLLASDGSRFNADSAPVWTGGGFRLSHLEVMAGDFDGDGDDDIALLQGLAAGQARLWVQTASAGRLANPVQVWDSGTEAIALNQANLVAGDFDGDGDDDIANVYETAGGTGKLFVHAVNQGLSVTPALRWDATAGTIAAGRTRFVAANVDGAGPDEIVAVYDDGATAARVSVIRNGPTWTGGVAHSTTAGSFGAGRATVTAGDFDADGRSDVGVLVDTTGGVRRLDTYASTGTGFVERRNQWSGYVSEAKPVLRVDSGRRYRILPTHSQKCFDVPGNSTANGAILDQWDCVTTATWEQFRLERLGASAYFHLRTAADKCLDMKSWSLLDNVTTVQWTCGNGGPSQANQQFRLEYLSGSGWDFVVQIRNAHTDKCLVVGGASTANGTPIVQTGCTGTPPANRQFLLRIEA
jgi:hypothetical protein